ncbi:hypothetical protein Tco_1191513 [Tanacetum coccineum]
MRELSDSLQWFEKMESVYSISNCTVACQCPCNAMEDTEKRLMTDKYCQGANIKKLELKCGLRLTTKESLDDHPPGTTKNQQPNKETKHWTRLIAAGEMVTEGPYRGPKPMSPQMSTIGVITRACFECGAQGHFNEGMPKGKNNNIRANITTTKDESKSNEQRLEMLPVVQEFPEVFLKDCRVIHPLRQVEFRIDCCKGQAYLIQRSSGRSRLSPVESSRRRHSQTANSRSIRSLEYQGTIPRSRDWNVACTKSCLTLREAKRFHRILGCLKKGLGGACVLMAKREMVISLCTQPVKIHENELSTHDLETWGRKWNVGADATEQERNREPTTGMRRTLRRRNVGGILVENSKDPENSRTEKVGTTCGRTCVKWKELVTTLCDLKDSDLHEVHKSNYSIHSGF